jgi:WD40 repeat protein
LSNYISLKKYELKEPSINLFSNFIINNNNLEDSKNLNFLEKISLYNNYFLNNFIIQKKLIYPEITCLNTLKSHTSSIDCIVQLYDGRIATGSSDGSVKIWNKNDYSIIKTLDLQKEKIDPIYSIHQMTNNY